MFVKLAVISCLVAVGSAVWNGPLAGGVPASQFPAGVSPQACPNYPNCANPAVAAQPNAAAPWNGGHNQWNNGGQGQWNGGHNQWNGGQNQWNGNDQWNNHLSPLDRGEYTGDGDWHGEGLAESGAYGNNNWGGNNGQWNNGNHGQWNGNQGAWNGQHAGVGQPAQIPAGVDAHACPNYPFCH